MASEELNARNINTLHEHVKRVDTTTLKVEERVNHLEAVIAQQNAQIQQLQQTVNVLRVMNMGTGPTVNH